jgi:hypothetical protein
MPGVFYDVVQQVCAAPPDMPAGQPLHRYADDAEFAGPPSNAGLVDVTVSTVAYTYRDVGDLFDCPVDGTVRTRGIVLAQSEATQARIRAPLARLTASTQPTAASTCPPRSSSPAQRRCDRPRSAPRTGGEPLVNAGWCDSYAKSEPHNGPGEHGGLEDDQ